MSEFNLSPEHPVILTVSIASALVGLAAPWWTSFLDEFHNVFPHTLQIAAFVLICVQIRYYWTRSK